MSNSLDDMYDELKIELADVKAQILSILGSGQEHSLNDGQSETKVKHPDLKDLQERKTSLLNELAAYEGCSVEVQYLY